MTVSFTVLLCLGLTLGHGTPVLAGTHPKPVLRVQPDSVVSVQTTVTFVCEGTEDSKPYILYKNGHKHLSHTKIPQKSNNRAEFSISNIGYGQAGRYKCGYQIPGGATVHSESLELVVTGAFSKPSLSARSSPVVTEGGSVILQCVSKQRYYKLTLTKEGQQKHFWTPDSVYHNSTGHYQAHFSVGPVTSSQRWIFRCYSFGSFSTLVWSEPSESLELLFSGTLHKPTIQAGPGTVVALGSPVNISCQGILNAELYFLHKDGSKQTWGTQIPKKPGKKSTFSIPSVTQSHAGQYRCYCYSSAGWTEHSDTLELVVTGLSKKPSLLTHQDHILDPGKNLILQCCSDINYDRFALYKVGGADFTQHQGQRTQVGLSLATFTLGNVSSSTAGQYRCYGAHKLSSEWSASSDPLDIMITGQLPDSPSLSVKPNSTVQSGDNVTLLCQSTYTTDTFILSKEGAAHQPQRMKSKSQDGEFQAEFSMSAVTSALSGTYSCYRSQDSSPYLLSHASVAVELSVSVTASENKDHTVENLIRMGLAVLVLIVLGILVLETWCSQKQSHHVAET